MSEMLEDKVVATVSVPKQQSEENFSILEA